MELTAALASVLAVLATQTPTLLVFVAGIFIAWTNRRRHPPAANLAFIAFLVLLISYLVFMPIGVFLPMFMYEELGRSASSLSMVLAGIAFLRAGVSAVAFVLLIMAVFTGRSPQDPLAGARAMERQRG